MHRNGRAQRNVVQRHHRDAIGRTRNTEDIVSKHNVRTVSGFLFEQSNKNHLSDSGGNVNIDWVLGVKELLVSHALRMVLHL